MTDRPALPKAAVILLHPSGEYQSFTHDPEDPLWWTDDKGLHNGWDRLADRVREFMERQTHA